MACEPPESIILNGPTVGVDIGAKYDIHKLLRELAASGMAIIVVSDDASEVIATCDRALVMQAGHVTGNLSVTTEAWARLHRLRSREGVKCK